MVSNRAGFHALWHGNLTVLFKKVFKNMNQLSKAGIEQSPAGNET